MRQKLEIHIQNEILLWFNLNFSPDQGLIFPVYNESSYKNNQQTVLKGVSDLVVLFPNKAIFVEVKNGNNVQTKHQIMFESRLKTLGYDYHVVYSLNEFKELCSSIK